MDRDESTRIVRAGEQRPAEMWEDFRSARERFFALLASQAALYREARPHRAAEDADDGERTPMAAAA